MIVLPVLRSVRSILGRGIWGMFWNSCFPDMGWGDWVSRVCSSSFNLIGSMFL